MAQENRLKRKRQSQCCLFRSGPKRMNLSPMSYYRHDIRSHAANFRPKKSQNGSMAYSFRMVTLITEIEIFSHARYNICIIILFQLVFQLWEDTSPIPAFRLMRNGRHSAWWATFLLGSVLFRPCPFGHRDEWPDVRNRSIEHKIVFPDVRNESRSGVWNEKYVCL